MVCTELWKNGRYCRLGWLFTNSAFCFLAVRCDVVTLLLCTGWGCGSWFAWPIFKRYCNSNSNNNNNNNVIIRDNKQGTCLLIHVAIPGDRNLIKKEAEKILKYKDPVRENQRMWKVKAKVMPVIIGATGTISKALIQYLSNIPGKHRIKETQKVIAILGAARILQKVLM